jgi:hypothetical protein
MSLTLAQIASTLRANLSGGVLTLPASAFANTPVASLLTSYLPGGALVVGAAAVTTTADAVVLSGTGGAGVFAGAAVTATFKVLAGGAPSLALTATTPGAWTLGTLFPSLAGGLLDKLGFSAHPVFTLNTPDVSPGGLGLSASVLGNSVALANIGWMLKAASSLPVSGRLGYANGVYSLALAGPAGAAVTLGPVKSSVSFAIVVSPTSTTKGTTTSLQAYVRLLANVTATAQSKAVTIPIVAEYFGGTGALVFSSGQGTAIAASSAEISQLAANTNLAPLLPGGFSLGSVATVSRVALTVDPAKRTVTALEVDAASKSSWSVVPGQVSVDGVVLAITVANPASKPAPSVSLTGKITLAGTTTLDAAASYPGFKVSATLGSPVSLPISRVTDRFLPGVTLPVTNLAVNTATLTASASPATFDLALGMAHSPAWTVPVGKTALTISNVDLDIAYGKPTAGKASGTFSGQVSIGRAQFDVDLAVPGALTFKGQLPSVTLSALIGGLCDRSITFPGGFDLTFQGSSVRISGDGTNFTFQLLTQVKGVGTFFFEAVKGSSGWGFVAAYTLGGAKLSSLPGLSGLAAIEGLVSLQDLILVLCSTVPANFSFPDLSQFANPSVPIKTITLPPQAKGLQAGFNAYGSIALGGNKNTGLLAKVLGMSGSATLAMALQIGQSPATQSALYASINGTINKNLTLTGTLGLQLVGGQPSLLVSGGVDTHIQGNPAHFDVTLAFVPNGAFLSGDMLGTVKILGVTLSNLALEVGIDFEGLPSVGVAATVGVGNFESSIAVFFDANNPAQSMFAGSVSNLSLKDVADSLAGVVGTSIPAAIDAALARVAVSGTQTFSVPSSVSTALNARSAAPVATAFAAQGVTISGDDKLVLINAGQPGVWHVTDLATMKHYSLRQAGSSLQVSLDCQVYAAPQDTQLANLPVFKQGFFLNGELDFFGLTARATITVSTGTGIAADATLTPITILDKHFFSLTAANGAGGPQLSVSTFTQPQQADPMFRPPHALVNASLTLLGRATAVYLSVTASGLVFTLSFSPVPGTSLSLSGNFTSLTSLAVSGSAQVGLTGALDFGPLGQISVNANLANGSLALGYDGKAASATVSGGVSIPGVGSYDLSASLDVSNGTFADIPTVLLADLRGFLSGVLADATRWLGFVKSGIMQGIAGAEQVGTVLAQSFGKGAQEVASLTKQALGYGANEVAAALKGAGATADQAAKILDGLGYDAGVVQGALKNAFTNTHADVSIGHLDTPAGPHADTPMAPHLDTSTHTDIASGPHVDFSVGHIDTHGDNWYDPVGHVDTGTHTDTSATPHADFSVGHIDTPTAPHADTQVPPHVDAGTHVDTTV